jgi:hypothetical protein
MKLHHGGWALLAALLLGAAGLAQADTLTGVLPATPGGTNYQAYYDSTTNLTWLANANVNGAMTWSQANNWAAGLDINGVTGWTLPTTTQPDSSCSLQEPVSGPVSGFPTQGYGYNCTGSEMGELYYDAGIRGSSAGQFSNVQSYPYWSATEFAPDTNYVWGFDFGNGYQDYGLKDNGVFFLLAWAVHAGNVGAPPTVPEPGAISLMLVGLALVGLAARRRLALRSFE